MMKYVMTFCAAVIAGSAFVGSATEASANCCGTAGSTRVVYRTVNKVSNVTRYRDVYRTRYVTRVNRVVHVTRVQPVIRVHQVMRVHYRTVAAVRTVHVNRVQYLRPRHVTTSSVRVYRSGCNC